MANIGIFQRVLASSLTGETYKTFCFETTTGRLKGYDGSRFRDINAPYMNCADFGTLSESGDNSSIIQATHDACGSGDTLVIPPGSWPAQDLRFSKSDLTILCFGSLRPVSASSTPVIYLGMNAAGDTVATSRIHGNLRVDTTYPMDPNAPDFFWTALRDYSMNVGIRLKYLYFSDLLIDACGFGTGLYVGAGKVGSVTGKIAYNRIQFGQVWNNKVGCYISTMDTSSWANNNQFLGGSFSVNDALMAAYLAGGGTIANCWHIYIDGGYPLGHAPDMNIFYDPAFEGRSGNFYNNGDYNYCVRSRMENTKTGTAGTDYHQPYFRQGDSSVGGDITTGWNDSSLTNYLEDLGVGTRVTSPSASNRSFTLNGDVVNRCWKGAPLIVSFDAADSKEYVLDVESATYSSGTGLTTVRVSQPLVTKDINVHVKAFSIWMDSQPNANTVYLANSGIPSTMAGKYFTTNQHRISLTKSAVEIQGINNDYPALRLNQGAAATDLAFEINNASEQKVSCDHSGNLGLSTIRSTYYYFGNPNDAGSWKFRQDGDDLSFDVSEGGSWVTKFTILKAGGHS